jgi:hypothetical protein
MNLKRSMEDFFYHVSNKDQMADIFTKPLEEGQFTKLRMRRIGW